jgi:hypothetical protein
MAGVTPKITSSGGSGDCNLATAPEALEPADIEVPESKSLQFLRQTRFQVKNP